MKFSINAGTYPFTIKVIITNDLKKAVRFVNRKQRRKGYKKYQIDNFKPHHAAFCSHEKYEAVMWMENKPKTTKQLCYVAHEILHAVFATMERVGITYNNSSEEAFTYLHTHFMKQFLNKCGIK